jgi:hypothetical protein
MAAPSPDREVYSVSLDSMEPLESHVATANSGVAATWDTKGNE